MRTHAFIVALLLLALATVLPAQGGLNIGLSPAQINAGEPCDRVFVTLSNLIPGIEYTVAMEVRNAAGQIVPGYFSFPEGLTADSNGTITMLFCVEIAPGDYTVNGAAVTPTQTLTGTATLTSG